MSCMKRVWRRLFGTKPMRILLLGLDAAGKTTILYQLMGKGGDTVPTIGFNVESIKVPPLEFLVWDVSGQERLRTFWRHYYHGTTGIVFVVDSHDVERLPIAKRELHGILKEEELNDAVLLIIANKTDLPNAVSAERLAVELDLAALQGRVMHIQPAVAQKGTGLKEGLVWLAKAMKAHSKQQARLQQSAGSGTQPNAVQPTSMYPSSSSTSATATQQPAYNYLNPYDSQTVDHSGSDSTTQSRQQQSTAGAADGGVIASSTASTSHTQPITVVSMTVVAVPSSSTLSPSLPSSSLAPVVAHSAHSDSSQPPLEQHSLSTDANDQPGLSSTQLPLVNGTQPAVSTHITTAPASSSSSSSAADDPSVPLSSTDTNTDAAPVSVADASGSEQQ